MIRTYDISIPYGWTNPAGEWEGEMDCDDTGDIRALRLYKGDKLIGASELIPWIGEDFFYKLWEDNQPDPYEEKAFSRAKMMGKEEYL